MRVRLADIDVSEDYDDAGYFLRYTSNGKMFDGNIGVQMILVPNKYSTDSDRLVECKLTPQEAARLGDLLLAMSKECELKFSKPRKEKRR